MRFQDGSGRVQTETWVYNAFNQVTQIQTQTAPLQNPTGVTPIVDLNYQYPAGQNNGQITGLASGTTPAVNATYTYDALSRLTGVTGSAGANRTQSFSYDGWGNLYAKTGGGLNFTSGVDAATNRLTVACHDANGNLLGVGGCATYSYDVLNRLSRVAVSSSGATDGSGHTDLSAEYYSYTADNKRVTTWRPNGNSQQVFYVYGAKGEMAGLCTVQVLGQALNCEGPRELRFAGRVFQRNNQFVVSDRLGSVVANAFVSVAGSLPTYPPYGESGGLATGVYPGNSGFATYFEDQTTGLDYADQRFYNSTYGRLMSADPYLNSAGATDPGGWNKYSYVGNDPINFLDPRGLTKCDANGTNCYDSTTVYSDNGSNGGIGSGSTPKNRIAKPVENDGGSQGILDYAGLLDLATNIAAAIKVTPGYTECQGLADFIGTAATSSTVSVDKALGIFTPTQTSSTMAKIFTSDPFTSLYSGGLNGFAAQYQNTKDDVANGNGDQVHHFSAFFQFGSMYGASAGVAAAYTFEYGEGLFSGINQGDIRLGVAAAQLGADFSSGGIKSSDLARRVSDLCVK